MSRIYLVVVRRVLQVVGTGTGSRGARPSRRGTVTWRRRGVCAATPAADSGSTQVNPALSYTISRQVHRTFQHPPVRQQKKLS